MAAANGPSAATTGSAAGAAATGAALTPDFVASATGGTWRRPPGDSSPFAGASTDSRDRLRSDAGRCLFFALVGAAQDGHAHVAAAAAAGAGAVVVSREIDLAAVPREVGVLRVDDTLAALQQLAGAWRRAIDAVVIGVTGSAGKTTTRRLIHAALSTTFQGAQSPKSFNNHVGVPLTLLSATAADRFVVVEIGMNAPGEIAALTAIAAPEIGVVTSIGHAHLGGLGSVEAIAWEKSRLLHGLRDSPGRHSPGAVAIATADSAELRPLLAGVPGLQLVGEATDADLRLVARRAGVGTMATEQEVELESKDGARLRLRLRLPGRHNALNAAAAALVARRLGVADAKIVEGLAALAPEAMRLVPRWLGAAPASVLLVDDAYNANPESMAASLATYSELAVNAARRVVILGDMLELGPEAPRLHAAIAERVAAAHSAAPLAEVVLIGPNMAHAATALATRWSGPPRGPGTGAAQILHLERLDPESIAGIVALVRPGDAVLLKASRGMALERIAAALADRFASPQTGQAAAPPTR